MSPDLVSKVTDAVHEEIREWQARPLKDIYALVYFDAVRAKTGDDGLVRNKVVHLGISVMDAGAGNTFNTCAAPRRVHKSPSLEPTHDSEWKRLTTLKWQMVHRGAVRLD